MIPSMVSEVSAIFVAITTFRVPGGAGSKIRDCISEGRALYTGRMISSGTYGIG